MLPLTSAWWARVLSLPMRAGGGGALIVHELNHVMDERTSQRRRRRRRKTGAPVPATPPTASVQEPPAPAQVIAQSAAQAPARPDTAGEQVWERTHLEQTMFTLAREHAEAAAQSAHSSPPDPQGEQTHSLLAVLMSFLALEAFINMVGSDRLGPRYRYYDRMPPEGKWGEVTRLVSKSGKTFDEDGPEMRALSALRTWRNMLTHYKGEYEDVQQRGRGGETRIEALLSAENAARAVEIARMLYRAFYELDRRSPPRQFIWLDARPHQPPGAASGVPAPVTTSLPATAPPGGAPGGVGAGAPRETSVARSHRSRRRRR